MGRIVLVTLVLSLSFGSALSAQQLSQGALRASIDREAARMSSSVAVQIPEKQIDKSRADERVRITLPARRSIVGWVERIDGRTLTLTPQRGPAVTVPLDEIARIERPNGKRSRGKSAFAGLLIGTAGGVGVALVSTMGCREDPHELLGCDFDRAAGSIFLGGIGSVAGVVTGLLIPTQRWTTVPLSSLAGTFPTPP